MHSDLQLKLIRFYFSLVSSLAPGLAVYSAHKLFHYPVNTQRKNRDERPLPKSEHFAIPLYDNVTLQGYRWGEHSKPAVLLVHGWSTTSRSMSHITEQLLKEGYQVFSYDALRHGNSQREFADLASWADSVQAALKSIGPVECIIAHSFGAAAVTVASKLGLSTQKLVLISPIHDIQAVADRFAGHFGIADEIIHEMTKYTWQQNREAFEKYGKGWKDILKSDFHVPTLLIHDDEDREIGIKHSREIQEIWPWAELITTHGLGHRRILDDGEVVHQVLNFVNS